jgi:hypothetical protein
MVVLLAAVALAPWAHPLAFGPLAGWQTGGSGNLATRYSASHTGTQSSAWIATNVRYVDGAAADPPNHTLAHLPAKGVIVWAVIYTPAAPSAPLRLDLGRARHLPCCEATPIAGGLYELTGTGPAGAYSAIVRVYFGSRPTAALRAEAQRALDRLALPALR